MVYWEDRLGSDKVSLAENFAEQFMTVQRKATEAELHLFEKLTMLGMSDEEADHYINLLTGELKERRL